MRLGKLSVAAAMTAAAVALAPSAHADADTDFAHHCRFESVLIPGDSCPDARMCQGWRSHQRGDVEDALYAADREVSSAAPSLGAPRCAKIGRWLLLSAGPAGAETG